MKIRSIRITNLACYAGEHFLDFTAPELDAVGIMTLTGPTGAGKSMLLDAITLGLFGHVARLPTHQKAAKVQGTASSDARSLLRSDAGEGGVEVDFTGTDGIHYRARWWVRRARKKVTGKLQQAQWTLLEVESDRLVADKKRDVAEAIESRVGFTQREFSRSVVLPQGRFAALLHGSRRERADLLEKLTGTGVYSELSMRAHRRQRELREQMERLDEELAAKQDALGAVAIDPFRLDALQAARAFFERQRAGLQEQLSWLDREAELARAEQHARDALAESEAALARAVDPELESVESLAPLRAPLAGLALAEEALQKCDERLATLQKELPALQKRYDAAKERRAAAASALDASETRQQSLTPAIREARKLDGLLEELRRTDERLEKKFTTEEEAQRLAASHRDALRRDHEAALAALRALRDWLDAHPRDALLAQRWPELDTALREHARLLHEVGRLDAEHQAEQPALDALAKRLAVAFAAHDQADQAVEVRRAECKKAAQALADLDPASCAPERTAIEAERKVLASAAATLDVWQRALAEADTSEREQARFAGLERGYDARRRELQEHHRQSAGDLEVLRRRLLQALDEASLEDRRAALTPGDPCPLCGSLEHPYAAGAPGRQAFYEAEVERAQRETDDLQHAYRLAERDAAEAGRGRTRAYQARSEAERAAAAAFAEIQALRADLRGDDPATVRARLLAAERDLERRSATQEQRDATIDAARGALAALEADRSTAETELRRLAVDLADLQRRHAAKEATLTELTRRREATSAKLRAATEALRALAVAIDPDLPLERAELDVRVRGFEAKHTEHQKRTHDVARLADQLDNAEAGSQMAAQRSAEAEADRARHRHQLQESLAQRAALLEGRAADEVEDELARERTERQAALAEADQHRTRLRDALRSQRVHAETSETQRNADRQKLRERRTAVEADLQATGISRAHADALFAAWPETRVVEAQQARAERLQKVQHCRGALTERERDLATHRRDEAPAAPRAEIESRLKEVQQAADLTCQEVRAAELALARVRDANEELTRLQEERAALEVEAAPWLDLAQLIGSATGDRFRDFAQGLTLAKLVHAANEQLDAIAPRFQLERVGDLDLAVIDRDDAGERRAVQTLSGGETFLVSLSLALALGALFGDRVQTHSLFIDEGFGSLDTDTLDVALAALEKLHAQGRQVVLISHVQGLAERFDAAIQIRRRAPGDSYIEVHSRLERAA